MDDNSRSVDAAPIFIEGHHDKQRVEDGITFPKILLPHSVEQSGVAALVRGITSSSQWLQEELHRHSAILFRGFSVRGVEDFAAVSQAFGWEPMKYRGLATRHEIFGSIYTANEGPLDAEIWLHHEMSQTGPFPSKIIFFCEIEPVKAGETPIVLSHKAAEQIEMQFPAFMEELQKDGVLFITYLTSQGDHSSVTSQGWQTLFDTTDEAEAEERVARFPGRIEWQPDKTAKLIMGPFQGLRSFRKDGRKVWFHNFVGFDKPKHQTITCGNGSELPAEAVDGCNRILRELEVEIPWRQGDVLVLDNLAVMHGRRAGVPPRRILTAMFK